VRGNVGGHPHGNAGRAVHEQIRKRRREHRGLRGGLVEVGRELDRVLVEIDHRRFGERHEPRLGVAIRRGRVAIDRSEVPLTVDQGIAHVELLRQAHERVVRRHVAVGVVVADDLADDLRALPMRAVRGKAHLTHGEEDATVRRFQAVAHVGERAPDDHAHRVIQVRAAHFVFDVDRDA
jgi:hypothetical protein